MNVTFIIRNLTEATLQELQGMESRAAFDRLHKWAFGDLRHCVSVKFVARRGLKKVNYEYKTHNL